MHQLLPSIHAGGNGAAGLENASNPLGAYTINVNGNNYVSGQEYDPNDGRYEIWTMTYGQQHIRKFTLGVDGSNWNNYYNGSVWTTYHRGYGDHVDSDVSDAGLDNIVGTSTIYVWPEDLGRAASADPDFSSGVCFTTGLVTTGGFVLNPVPLEFNDISYDAGELALISCISGTSNLHTRKVMMLYDLRQVRSYTDKEPDYDTGQDGLGNQGSLYGAYDQADWNDVFYPLVTGEDIAETISGSSLAIRAFNFGRQVIWAPDGSAIYFAGFAANPSYNKNDPESIHYWNGIWRYEMASGELSWIKRDYSGQNGAMYYCEMAAVDTSVRDFTGGHEHGVQILYSSETENVGGISCIVDNGQVNPEIYTVVDVNDLAVVNGLAVDAYDTRNIVVSPEGELYFYVLGNSISTNLRHSLSGQNRITRGPNAVFCYDLSGRIYAVSNRAMHMNFHNANGTSVSGSTGAMGAFQYYPNLFGKKMLTYRSTPLKAPCAIEILKPLDFNLDGEVNITDLEIFRDNRILDDSYLHPFYSDKSGAANVMPSLFEASNEYLACDLNGNASYRSVLTYEGTGEMVPVDILASLDYSELDPNVDYIVDTDKNYFNEKVVTEDDAEVLYGFIPVGDADLDQKVDLNDFALLATNYMTGSRDSDRRNFSEGDFDFDGDVDVDDLLLMAENWLCSVRDYTGAG